MIKVGSPRESHESTSADDNKFDVDVSVSESQMEALREEMQDLRNQLQGVSTAVEQVKQKKRRHFRGKISH